jgi:hypothetical protein
VAKIVYRAVEFGPVASGQIGNEVLGEHAGW